MYQGKYASAASNRAHSKSRRNRRNRWHKQVTLLVSIAALLCFVVGGSVAYIFMDTDPVQNIFIPAKAEIDITEDFQDGGTEKKDVDIANKSDFPVYIRASYVATWQDENGAVYPAKPEISITFGDDWTENTEDGYYYYSQIVPVGETAENFIVTCSDGNATPDGYHLVVEVFAEAIQAEPEQAVIDAWGHVPGANTEG